jgi:hypothetical protein
MKNLFSSLLSLMVMVALIFSTTACAQDEDREWKPEDTEYYEPVPPKVTPQGNYFLQPPSDATVLFDGKDMNSWESVNGGDVKWQVSDGKVTVVEGTGAIRTKDVFDSFQLYLEWQSPGNMEHTGQDRGNSGVFLQGIYEVQVLDVWENETYVNGMAGSVYKQNPPLANVSIKPGGWNSYNISYSAPEFNEDGSLVKPAYVTVVWNGVIVQNNFEIQGDTPYIGLPEYTAHGAGPIMLQDHNSKVSYRNIWIREL